MPDLIRPDGARIHWEAIGEGPTIVYALQFFGYAAVFENLTAELATDHRIVTYDIRGAGTSSPEGPFDPQTDADDLEALIEQVGGPVVLMPIADGTNRAVRVAARRPDLVHAVLTPGGSPVGRAAVQGTDGLAASESVIDALMNMAQTDYRGALHAMLSVGNPNLDEEQLKQRIQLIIEHVPHEVALERMHYWIGDDASDEARQIGDKLWLLEHGTNPWFPLDVVEPTRSLLPRAHIELIEDGPVTRPDITAAYLRRLASEIG